MMELISDKQQEDGRVWHILTSHPRLDTRVSFTIRASVSLMQNDELALSFILKGDLSDVHLPIESNPQRRDGLWRDTCFEVFVAGGGTQYYEFNFSPSRCWAAYAFSDYRERLIVQDPVVFPIINLKKSKNRIVLTTKLPFIALPLLGQEKKMRIGLSSVIKTDDGNLTYWALCHPAGTPDFHCHRGFLVNLAAS